MAEALHQGLLISPDLQEVLGFYEIDSSAQEVLPFLIRHKTVTRALLAARPHLFRVFGTARRALQVERDPEGGADELFCVIHSDEAPQTVLDQLSRFDDSWLRQAPPSVRRYLNFTVDPV